MTIPASKLTGLLIPVYVPTLLLTLGQGVMVPTLPYYAQSFGVSFALVSVVIAAAGFGTMLADVPVGMAMARVGRKPLMLIGTFSLAGAFLVMAVAGYFPVLIVCQVIAGIATAMWNISRMAYITEVIPIAERGRVLSTFGGIMRVGLFVGPAVGGFIGSAFGLSAPFYLAAALAGCAAIISVLFVPETRASRAVGHKLRWKVLGQLARTQFQDIATAGAAQIFGQMIRAGRQLIIPLYASSALGLDVAAVGTILSISAALDMSLFMPAGYIMDHFGRKWASVPCFLIMGIGMALVPFARDYTGLLMATLVIALGNGLGSGTMMTLGADLAPREATGEFLGLWRLIGDVGGTGGPLVVGSIADLFGLGMAAFTLAGIGAVAATTLALFVRETLVSRESKPVAPV